LANFKELYNFLPKNCHKALKNMGLGSRDQKDTGSRIQIRSTALVCFFSYFLLFICQANGLSVRNELLSFHSKWYSSNIMAMAILGQQVGEYLL
jgi:hypothetical protein